MTDEDVEDAMGEHEDWHTYESDLPVYGAWITLRAEVRRLREELADAQSQVEAADSYSVSVKAEYEEHRKRVNEESAIVRQANLLLSKRMSEHSCGGGPPPCGSCCGCLEAQAHHALDNQRAKLARVEKELNRLWYDVRDPIAENVPGHPEPVGLQVFEMYDEALRDALKDD